MTSTLPAVAASRSAVPSWWCLGGTRIFEPTSTRASSNGLDQTLRLRFENSTRAIDSSKHQPKRLRFDRARASQSLVGTSRTGGRVPRGAARRRDVRAARDEQRRRGRVAAGGRVHERVDALVVAPADVRARVEERGADGVVAARGRDDERREARRRRRVDVRAGREERRRRRRRAVLRRVHERREAVAVGGGDVGAAADERGDDGRVAARRRGHERRDAVAPRVRRVGAAPQEELGDGEPALARREPERGHAARRRRVERRRRGLEEPRGDVGVAADRRLHERRDVVLVAGRRVRAGAEELADERRAALGGRRDERGEAVPVPRVDGDAVPEQLADAPLVAVAGRADELRAVAAHGLDVGRRRELERQRDVRLERAPRDAGPEPLADDAVLAAVLAERVARLRVADDVPPRRAAVLAVAEPQRGLGQVAARAVEAQVLVDVVDLALVDAVGARAARDVPERVDAAALEGAVAEAEAVGGRVLQEEGRRSRRLRQARLPPARDAHDAHDAQRDEPAVHRNHGGERVDGRCCNLGEGGARRVVGQGQESGKFLPGRRARIPSNNLVNFC